MQDFVEIITDYIPRYQDWDNRFMLNPAEFRMFIEDFSLHQLGITEDNKQVQDNCPVFASEPQIIPHINTLIKLLELERAYNNLHNVGLRYTLGHHILSIMYWVISNSFIDTYSWEGDTEPMIIRVTRLFNRLNQSQIFNRLKLQSTTIRELRNFEKGLRHSRAESMFTRQDSYHDLESIRYFDFHSSITFLLDNLLRPYSHLHCPGSSGGFYWHLI